MILPNVPPAALTFPLKTTAAPFTLPDMLRSPVTVKLSSTVTVPPAESNVKFPVMVSISFPLISTLSNLADPTVEIMLPLTVKLSSIMVVPPAESIVKLPVDVSISLSSVTPIFMLPFVAPFELKSPLTTKLS